MMQNQKSEMLGNQYFMARNYEAAVLQYEWALNKQADNKTMRRRLIVCYCQIGAVRKAFDLFRDLVIEDADFIINTDPVDDDCPCPELVKEMEANHSIDELGEEARLKLAMLWLYCDLNKSIEYFSALSGNSPESEALAQVMDVLRNKQLHMQDIDS